MKHAFPLLALIFILILNDSTVHANTKNLLYKSHISYLYLYKNNLQLILTLYKSKSWDDNKILSTLNTSLSLIQGQIKDFYQLNNGKLTTQQKQIILNIRRSIKITKLFIQGIASDDEDWLKSFLPSFQKYNNHINNLVGMEE